MASKVRWTKAQEQGITTTGRSLLVSAAAGSGKTAILAERCAHLICNEHCNVDELLVVTFTEAAAAEMKSRIHSALRDRAAEEPSERLHRQLAQIDRAHVSTIHSFCARLLREHFHVVGLDPSFTVLDGEEAGLLRREVARELFDDRYELDETCDFHRFIDAYGEGDDAQLIRRVIHTYEMLTSLVDSQGWIARSQNLIAEASDGELTDTELGEALVRVLCGAIAENQRQCQRATQLVTRLGQFPAYVAALNECGRVLRYWEDLLAKHGIDALAEHVGDHKHPRLPAVSSSLPGKDLAKQAVDSVREAMTGGPLGDLLRFTSAHWQEGLHAIRPHADVFLKLLEEFASRYRLAKDSARVVDFADLERFALEVLSERHEGRLVPSAAARSYHRRFAHVLVDEYQDINEIQDAILALVSRECVSDEPATAANLFCVGDVKQSIYRFRLAETGRFLQRQKRFREDKSGRVGEVIDLQSNFRSRSALLEAINRVFEHLMTKDAVDIEYDKSHRLHAGLAYPTAVGICFTGAPIEMHLLPAELTAEDQDEAIGEDLELDRSEREAALVAQRIRRLMGLDGSTPMQVIEKNDAGGLRERPVRLRDIVVLLRSMRYKSEQYADILRRSGIPVHAQSGTGYFQSMEVRDMLSLLGLLENQRQDIPLAAVLRSPLANIPEPENCFARIRLAFPAHGEDALPFHEAVIQYAGQKQDELAAALCDFLNQLARWRQMAHSRPLAEVISDIYEKTGYLAFCAGLHDGDQRVANLKDLHSRASQFGSFRRQSLPRFMQFLESLRDEIDLGQPSIASEADDVVRVMSIHRSKGQEFPVVILPDLGKRINLSDSQGTIVADRSAGLGLAVVDEHRMIRYPSLALVLVQRRIKQQALAEEMRVLYVAMTRAREHVILIGTCPQKADDGWTQRWAGYEGAFPSDMVLGARTMLDWIGPVAAAAGEGIFSVTRHSAEEVKSWQAEHAKRPELSPQQVELAGFKPLDINIQNSAAEQVVGRLEFAYPFDAFTKVAAAGAVTGLSRAARAGEAPPEPHGSRHAPRAVGTRSVPATETGATARDAELRTPKFLTGYAASPTDIGTATHLVLQHLDFDRPGDGGDISRQLQEMIDRRLITDAEAKLVDTGTIEWFLSTETAALIKANSKRLRRELPVYFAIAPAGLSSNDEQDRVMVRGRIDLLVCAADGAVIIDYKTDKVTPQTLPDHIRDYAAQMQFYRDAVARISANGVCEVRLVFLNARAVQSL